jgi:DNA-binding response OmpR family regulator
MRLLLIEDDDILGEGLRDYLRSEGHVVDWLRCLADAASARGEPYDAWLVDWQLPDGSGLDWLHARRAQGQVTPALMLTARDRLADRLQGLDGGADDYLVKPFAIYELLARIEAVHRRTAHKPAMELEAGDLHLSLATKRLAMAGRTIELTPTEFSILELLMRYKGQVVTRKMLCEHVWGFDWDGPTNVIEVHINRLRGKLDKGRDNSLIRTIRGRGYALTTV